MYHCDYMQLGLEEVLHEALSARDTTRAIPIKGARQRVARDILIVKREKALLLRMTLQERSLGPGRNRGRERL